MDLTGTKLTSKTPREDKNEKGEELILEKGGMGRIRSNSKEEEEFETETETEMEIVNSLDENASGYQIIYTKESEETKLISLEVQSPGENE